MATPEDETLQIGKYHIIDVPGNGWCFYTSILLAVMLLEDPAGAYDPTDKRLQQLSLQTAVNISQVILTNVESVTKIQLLLEDKFSVSENLRDLDQKLAEVDKDPTAKGDPRLIEALKESLRMQYVQDGTVYMTGQDGQPFTDVTDYVTKLATPMDPADLSKGPVAWPDAAVIGKVISEMTNVKLYIYQLIQGEYKLVASFGTELTTDKRINILYTNRNHYSILSQVGSITDAKAMQLGAKPKLSKPNKFLSTLQAARTKVAGTVLHQGLAKADASGATVGRYRQEIIVAGERVRLNENGFDPSKHTDVASFSRSYFPGETHLEGAKKIFSMVFNRGTFKSSSVFRPPCDDDDYKILLGGLANRLETLNMEMQDIRSMAGDTVLLRFKLELYDRIRILMEELDDSYKNGICQEYNGDGSPKGFKVMNLQLDNQVRDLLRQFAFMALQAQMPVEKYDNITADAKAMMNQLDSLNISREEMANYIKTWNEQASQMDPPQSIPNIVAEVLDASDDQPGLITTMVDDQLESIYTQILVTAREEYSIRSSTGALPPILTEFESYITTLETTVTDFRTRVMKLIQWILKKNKSCIDDLGAAQEEERANMTDLISKAGDLNQSRAELAAVKHNLNVSEEKLKATAQKGMSDEDNLRYQQVLAEYEAYKSAPRKGMSDEDKLRYDQVVAEYEAYKSAQRKGISDEDNMRYAQVLAEYNAYKSAQGNLLRDISTKNIALEASAAATSLSQRNKAEIEHAAAAASSATVALENTLAARNRLVANQIQATQRGGGVMETAMSDYHSNVLDNFANETTEQLTTVVNAKADSDRRANEAEKQKADLQKQVQTMEVQIGQMQKDMTQKDVDAQNILSSLRDLGKNIVSGNQYTIPKNIAPNAGNAFKELYGQVMTRVTPAPSVSTVSNATCFLNYFVTFFTKAIFYSKTMPTERKRVMDIFDTVANNVVAKVQQLMEGSAQKDVLYAIVNTVFNLLENAQTLFINKEGAAGQEPTTGLQVIKSGKLDPNSIAILNIIYVEFYGKATPTFIEDMKFMEKVIFEDLLIQHPAVYFNPPMEVKYDGRMLPAGNDLTTYPSMVYIPSTITDGISEADMIEKLEGMKGSFHINDKGVLQTVTIDKIVEDPAAQKLWSDAIFLKLQDATLQYPTLFIAFIVFARRYLLLIKEDLGACSVSSFLAKPSLGS